jgi:hypothetical protein
MSAGRLILAGAAALMMTTGAGTLVAQSKNELPASLGDLKTAQLVEVRDQSGQVLLHGTLKTSSNKPKETEREAVLESPSGQSAKGKVDVDIDHKDGVDTKGEVEVTMEKLPAMTQLELFIDGTHVSTFTTSKGGKAEVKLERKKS